MQLYIIIISMLCVAITIACNCIACNCIIILLMLACYAQYIACSIHIIVINIHIIARAIASYGPSTLLETIYDNIAIAENTTCLYCRQ